MADFKSPEERSRNMSRIRSKDTKPEVWFRKQLFAQGYRYRKNVNYLPGHPDLWLAKYNTAVFVNGCFWHRHEGCKYSYTPKSRIDFWTEKFQRNIRRDKQVYRELAERGVKTLVVWECTVNRMMKDPKTAEEILEKVEEFLRSNGMWSEL